MNYNDILTSIEKPNRLRILKFNDSIETEVSSYTKIQYVNDTITKYFYKNLCDSVIFIYDYRDTSIIGSPFILTFWNPIKNNSRIIEFELARPPFVEYKYYINNSEVVFESDSTTSYFYKAKINKFDSIKIECVFYKNKDKWKVYQKNLGSVLW